MRLNHLKTIARYWNRESDLYCKSHPEYRDLTLHPSWGIWHLQEACLGLLDGELRPNRNLIDLGCGIGHDSVGFAQHGLKVLAVDISREQLKRAIRHPRVQYALAAAEDLPVRGESVDLAVSDHGAFDHSPPDLLLAELHRVLKPGGVLVVCTYSPLAVVCYDTTNRKIGATLFNDYPSNLMIFDGKLVANQFSYGAWISAFVRSGFLVERLEELRPNPNSLCYFDELVDINWASRWPTDVAWVVRKGDKDKAK